MPSSNTSTAAFSVVHAKSDFRSMLRLAIPALSEEMLVLAVTWTDWWLTGHFFQSEGDATKTAMSMMGYTMWLIPSLFAAVAIGATALVARFVGADNSIKASKAANQALLIGALMAGLMLSGSLWLGDEFLSVMQLQGTALVFAKQYFGIVIWSIPLIMFSIVGAACLRGAGDMVTGFVVKLIVVAANILISFSLVTGWGPIEAIGWRGLAIGAAIGHSIGGLIILVVLLRGRAGLQISWEGLRPHFLIIGQLL
ncbi:MAG: MATE family efflux transporter, partial [Planctomycetota bacterium]